MDKSSSDQKGEQQTNYLQDGLAAEGKTLPKKAKAKKKTWNSRPRRAKEWVDNLQLCLTKMRMWCYLQKKGNLNLCTINVNGRHMLEALHLQLLQLIKGNDCPIDGIVLIDTRP
jgi:hypothetical protein